MKTVVTVNIPPVNQNQSMITVTAAIIRKEDTVLLTRRNQGQRLAGYWEFPGGKLEEGETLQSCLEREIREELGWVIQVGEVVATNIHTYDRGDIFLVAMEATILSGTPTLTVHDDMAWVPVPNLLEYQLAPADIPIAKALLNKPSSGRLLPMTGPDFSSNIDQADYENGL